MSSSILSTSSINNLVQSYKIQQVNQYVSPLSQRKAKYDSLNSTWSNLLSKVQALQTSATTMKDTSSSSPYLAKTVTTSDSTLATATAEKTALSGIYSLRTTQLAKADVALSQTLASATSVAMANTYQTFKVANGNYSANVAVTFDATETNQTMMEKIANAINNDKATVQSSSFTSTDLYAGAAETQSFTIDLNGTNHTINYTVDGSQTYSQVMDSIATEINKISGVTAEKVEDGGNVSLKLSVTDNKNYISIDSTGNNLLTTLGISANKEKSAAGIAAASVFSPTSGNSKMSFAARETGYDNRLIFTDDPGESVFSSLGLVGDGNRFAKVDDNSAGYLYTATSSTSNQLNSVLTFNGIQVQRNTNVISDLVSGVTVTVKKEMTTEPDIQLTVNSDTSAVKDKIKDFIDKFNDAYKYIKNNSAVSKDSRGIFAGDTSAQSLMNTFRSIATGDVTGISSGNLKALREIGISFDPTNGLSVSNDSTLTTAIDSKGSQVESLFNSTNGIAARFYTETERYTKADGVITNLKTSLDSNIKYLNDKITSTNDRIDKSGTILRSRYEQLQTQLASLLLNSQSFGSFSNTFY